MKRYTVPKEIVFKEINDEAFIYNSKTEMCFGLDGLGLFIWKKLSNGESVENIILNIQEIYQEDRLRVEKDVNELINQLTEHSLLIPMNN